MRPDEPSNTAMTSDSDLLRKLILLEFIHILVGQEMDGPGIFGHLSLECALHLPRAGLLHRDTGLDGRDEKPVTVKAEKCHILHSATVRVYRTGDDFLHRRNFRLEIQHDVAVACLGLRILHNSLSLHEASRADTASRATSLSIISFIIFRFFLTGFYVYSFLP